MEKRVEASEELFRPVGHDGWLLPFSLFMAQS
jgi:hypothetical protein